MYRRMVEALSQLQYGAARFMQLGNGQRSQVGNERDAALRKSPFRFFGQRCPVVPVPDSVLHGLELLFKRARLTPGNCFQPITESLAYLPEIMERISVLRHLVSELHELVANGFNALIRGDSFWLRVFQRIECGFEPTLQPFIHLLV